MLISEWAHTWGVLVCVSMCRIFAGCLFLPEILINSELWCFIIVTTSSVAFYDHSNNHIHTYARKQYEWRLWFMLWNMFIFCSFVHHWLRMIHLRTFDHRHRSHIQSQLFRMLSDSPQNSIQSFRIVATSLTNTLWTLAQGFFFSLSNYLLTICYCANHLPKWSMRTESQNK